jgi:hypothetical protein
MVARRWWLTHAYNPSYSGGRDQEDRGSKPAWANNSRDPILKKPITEIDWWSGLRCRHCKTPALEKKKKGIGSAESKLE